MLNSNQNHSFNSRAFKSQGNNYSSPHFNRFTSQAANKLQKAYHHINQTNQLQLSNQSHISKTVTDNGKKINDLDQITSKSANNRETIKVLQEQLSAIQHGRPVSQQAIADILRYSDITNSKVDSLRECQKSFNQQTRYYLNNIQHGIENNRIYFGPSTLDALNNFVLDCKDKSIKSYMTHVANKHLHNFVKKDLANLNNQVNQAHKIQKQINAHQKDSLTSLHNLNTRFHDTSWMIAIMLILYMFAIIPWYINSYNQHPIITIIITILIAIILIYSIIWRWNSHE